MNEQPEPITVTSFESPVGPSDDEGIFTWGAESELEEAISLAFDSSLEALNELGKIDVRDNESGDVVWDDDGALVLAP
jgi:hypothetical protein